MRKSTFTKCFFLPENADEFPFEEYDYIVDAVDTVTAKDLISYGSKGKECTDHQQYGSWKIKLDPTSLKWQISIRTKVCPLAKGYAP